MENDVDSIISTYEIIPSESYESLFETSPNDDWLHLRKLTEPEKVESVKETEFQTCRVCKKLYREVENYDGCCQWHPGVYTWSYRHALGWSTMSAGAIYGAGIGLAAGVTYGAKMYLGPAAWLFDAHIARSAALCVPESMTVASVGSHFGQKYGKRWTCCGSCYAEPYCKSGCHVPSY